MSTRLYVVCSIVAYCIIFHYAHNSRHLNITHINIKPIHVSNQRKNKRRERIELAKNKDKINNNYIYGEGGGENDVVEIRPIRRRDAVEAGLDYWIDDSDFEREKQRRIAIKNRKVSFLSMAIDPLP